MDRHFELVEKACSRINRTCISSASVVSGGRLIYHGSGGEVVWPCTTVDLEGMSVDQMVEYIETQIAIKKMQGVDQFEDWKRLKGV